MNTEQTIHTAQPQTEDIDFSDVLLVAMDAGHILLENGAEIFRVEETMLRIGRHFGVQDEDVFVLSNGIFTTGSSLEQGHKKSFARVQHIPMHTASLDKVVAINQLSRDVEAGKYTLAETKEKLQEIREMTGKAHWKRIYCHPSRGGYRIGNRDHSGAAKPVVPSEKEKGTLNMQHSENQTHSKTLKLII